jgi:hypothetical protein
LSIHIFILYFLIIASFNQKFIPLEDGDNESFVASTTDETEPVTDVPRFIELEEGIRDIKGV